MQNTSQITMFGAMLIQGSDGMAGETPACTLTCTRGAGVLVMVDTALALVMSRVMSSPCSSFPQTS